MTWSTPDGSDPARPRHFVSELYSAIHDAETGATFIAGFATAADQLSQIDFKSREGKSTTCARFSHGEKNAARRGRFAGVRGTRHTCDFATSRETCEPAPIPTRRLMTRR